MEKNRSKNFRSRTLIPSAGDKFRKQTWSLVATRQGRKNKKWKEKKLEINVLRSINFEKKRHRANFLYKKNLGAIKVYAKDSKIKKVEINILTQIFKKKVKETKKSNQKIRIHKS